MKKILLTEGAMLRKSPADMTIMAAGVLQHLDTLKEDPDFMAGFEEWKRTRKEAKQNDEGHRKGA